MLLGIDASRANKKEKTGVEQYSYFLIQEFKKIIPEKIKVALYSPSALQKSLLPFSNNWTEKKLSWPPRKFWTLLRLSWEMLFHKPDALFVPSHIIPFFTPKKTFTTIHDIGFKCFPECYEKKEKKILDFGVRRALKKCEKIFVPSEFTKKELEKFYRAPSKKIIVIPLASSINPKMQTLSATDKILKKYDITKPYLFYIGRLEAKKNIKNMLTASRGLDIDLILAGKSGFGIQQTDCQGPRIKYLGWIDEEDVLPLIKEAEIFLYPSLYEGFGIPILDAFCCGTPVITSDCASMPEVAGNAATLVNPQNPDEIRRAIKSVLTNPEKREKMTRLGYEQCKKFSWQECAKETLKEILK